LSSSSQALWVPLVASAKRGEPGSREELSSYFTPFVHGVLISQLAHHVANEQTRLALEDALRRLPELNPATFGPWLIDAARKRAAVVGKSPGSTLEMLGGGPVVTEGKKVLSRLRRMTEPTRERLVFRLLEGVPGPEIAEVTGAAEAEVRDDLERGLNALLKELGQLGSTSSDSYLWSMVGNPHPAIVPLENQLTPLRYDPTVPEGLATEAIGVRANAPEPRGEGRRQTAPEQRRVVAPASPELKTAIQPANGSEEELITSPQARLMRDFEQGEPNDERTSVVDAPKKAGGEERTRMATDLPAEAQRNPFEQQPGTIPASDLPVAAGVERSSKPKRLLPGEEKSDSLGGALPITMLRARTGEIAQVRERPKDRDLTAPRPLPPSALMEPPSTGSLTPQPQDQDWRTSVMDVRTAPVPPKPQPFSMTRGSTPFALAAVFFTFFAAIAWVNLRGTEKAVKMGWNLTAVTVASESIPEGAVVDFDMISTRYVPEEFITSSVVKPDSAAYVVNQRLMVPVQAGDPLLWTQFETARAGERLSRRVPLRARAFTLVTSDIISVGTWVRPGDHVDIIVTVRDDLTKVKTASTTLQNLIILATGKMTASTNIGLLKPGQQQYSEVSLLAVPEEIEIMALMRERAQYRLVLRNEEDLDTLESGRSTMDTLLKGDRVSVLQKKRFQTIQLIRNAKPAEPNR
jgi:pilus assembly protein CpaB